MSTYRQAVLVFGLTFREFEDAVEFCRDQHEDDTLNETSLGLEYFDEYWILGYQMQPGETVDKYQLMWNAHCFDTKLEPKAFLDIRSW